MCTATYFDLNADCQFRGSSALCAKGQTSYPIWQVGINVTPGSGPNRMLDFVVSATYNLSLEII